eukprot:COSAG03_NODE_17548_length_373_cov_0.675182_1_plen_50_part_10
MFSLNSPVAWKRADVSNIITMAGHVTRACTYEWDRQGSLGQEFFPREHKR